MLYILRTAIFFFFMICIFVACFFFFKQKTAYEWRIIDWISDVCSSDLAAAEAQRAFAVEGRIVGLGRDRSGHRIAALQGALRAAQHFDLLDIPQLAVAEDDLVVAQRPAVELHVDARPAAGNERIQIGRAWGRERGGKYV